MALSLSLSFSAFAARRESSVNGLCKRFNITKCACAEK
jgi:hypothetical protein